MVEIGECSSSKSSNEIWAKLVPLEQNYGDIEIKSNETVIFSETKSSSFEKHEWCKIMRSSDLNSATLQNKSSDDILVDEALAKKDDIIFIKCGSEIVAGPSRDGYLSFKFEVLSDSRICKGLKISVDVEHSKCSICLNIWHDVVTAAPCFHNFCNGCFSEWLKRSQEKHTNVLCPQCRAVVQFVGRNHFLQNIAAAFLVTVRNKKRVGYTYEFTLKVIGEWSIKQEKRVVKVDLDVPEFSFGELDDLQIEVRLSEEKDLRPEEKSQICQDLKQFLHPVREKLLQFEQELKER